MLFDSLLASLFLADVFTLFICFVPAPNLSFFHLLAISQFEFCESGSAKKISKKDRFHVMVRTVKSRPKINQSEHLIWTVELLAI